MPRFALVPWLLFLVSKLSNLSISLSNKASRPTVTGTVILPTSLSECVVSSAHDGLGIMLDDVTLDQPQSIMTTSELHIIICIKYKIQQKKEY